MTNQEFLNDIAERDCHQATMKAPTALERMWAKQMIRGLAWMNRAEKEAFLQSEYHTTAGDIGHKA